MSMTFTKLFSSITESTVWCEDAPTRIVWITMLAMSDKRGRVWASVPGLASRAKVTVDETVKALDCFLSPDEWSRTKTNEGRRAEEIDGGWRLLNHAKYRAIRDEEERATYKADWIRNKRAIVDNVDKCRPQSTDVDACTHNAEAEAYTEAEINPKAWELYLSHRRELKARKLTDRGAAMARKKLARLSAAEQMQVVETTVENGWIGLFPDRIKRNGSHNKRPESFDTIHARNLKAAGIE